LANIRLPFPVSICGFGAKVSQDSEAMNPAIPSILRRNPRFCVARQFFLRQNMAGPAFPITPNPAA